MNANALQATRVSHGTVSPGGAMPNPSSTGRNEAIQKITVPSRVRPASSATHRANTVAGPDESELLAAATPGGGSVPVGSTRKDQLPSRTWPSSAEVIR